jgi:hypothetical protein
MARVLGIHEIELRPEADPVEFERVAAEVVSLPMFEGWTTRLLKGERGVRASKYLLVFEIVDTEARDRYFPAEHQGSDEIGRSDEQNRQAAVIRGPCPQNFRRQSSDPNTHAARSAHARSGAHERPRLK